jgi:hypothetical protein
MNRTADGLLRLVLPAHIPYLRIWDTPCPPALEGCQFYFERAVRLERLHAVSLDQITGLTFMIGFGMVHAHTHREPSALSTYRAVLSRYYEWTDKPPNDTWIYVPLSQGERIQNLVIRRFEKKKDSVFNFR